MSQHCTPMAYRIVMRTSIQTSCMNKQLLEKATIFILINDQESVDYYYSYYYNIYMHKEGFRLTTHTKDMYRAIIVQ